MSVNRENVTWQSKDGKWNRGFFDFYNVNESDPDWDYEWDVEYDFNAFNWVSTGHATEEAADRSWRGANPGGGESAPYNRANAKECARYDHMARRFLDPEFAKEDDRKKALATARKWEKDVRELFEADSHVGKRVSVTMVNPEQEGYGASYYFEGLMRQDGDWLVVTDPGMKPQKVFNTKTKKMWRGKTVQGKRKNENYVVRSVTVALRWR